MKRAMSILAIVILGLLAGVARPAAAAESVTLSVSTPDGTLYFLPFWIAEQKGQLKEAGITLKYLGFDGGPVQMEAYESWDIGTTGVGGALAGTLGHDAVILGACTSDSVTLNYFARPDSAIVKAGQGKNKFDARVYGDRETWKNAQILASYGDIRHYCLLKTMEGFNLSAEELNVLWMDQASCLTSFLGGQGDVTAVAGAATFGDKVKGLVRVINGSIMDLGLVSYMVGNANSLKDPVKYPAIKKLLKLYYENIEWMNNDRLAAKPYLESYYNHIGFRYTDEMADQYLTAYRYYLLKDNVETLFAKSPEGDYNALQAMAVNVIRFYQKYDVYQKGSDDKFLEPKHFNFDLLKEVYAGK